MIPSCNQATPRDRRSSKYKMLDLGCGIKKHPGAVGVDLNRDATAADVRADLNCPLPFPDSNFNEVRAVHVIEHVHDIMRTMAEIHRVAKGGGRLYLVTPHYTDSSSWRDPTHRWHLNTYSFRFWEARGLHQQRHWYTRLELRELHLHLELSRLWKWIGVEWLVNRSEPFRRFWEQYLCFVVRAKQMEFTFEVVKECNARRAGSPLGAGLSHEGFPPLRRMSSSTVSMLARAVAMIRALLEIVENGGWPRGATAGNHQEPSPSYSTTRSFRTGAPSASVTPTIIL